MSLARLLPDLLPIACSLLFAALQIAVSVITFALSWVELVGDALVSLLFLWDTLQSAPHSWLSAVGSGAMLLVALLSSLAYALVPMSARIHPRGSFCSSPWPPPRSSPGLYTLTAPQRLLTCTQPALLLTFLVETG